MRVTSNALTTRLAAGPADHTRQLWPLLVVAPLALAAPLSPHPGPWLMAAVASLLARLAIIARAQTLPTTLQWLLPAIADCATCLLIAVLSGHIGLGAAGWLALLALHGQQSGRQPGLVVIGAATLIGLAATQLFAGPRLLEPGYVDGFGSAAALLQAIWLLRWPAPVAGSLPLAALSHELRTPLNAIIGFAGLMRSLPADAREPGRQRDYARIIETSGEHILAVLEDAIGGAATAQRWQHRAADGSDVAGTIRVALDMVAGSAAKRAVSLQFQAPVRPIETDADRRALLQILINLLTNAVKFSPRQSTVEIDLSQCGNLIEIAVRDHGFGMDQADLARIGQPFARGSLARGRQIEGSGLGLAISHRLAEQLDGSLTLESALGAGTSARLRLPRSRPAQVRLHGRQPDHWPQQPAPIQHHA